MKKVLFIYGIYPPFIKWDYELFEKNFQVEKYHFDLNKNPFLLLISFFKLLVFLLFKGRKFDSYYIWFVDYHAFLPTLLGKFYSKKTILSIAGYDSVYLPQFKYGLFGGNKIRVWMAKESFKNATDIISCDESMIKSQNTFVEKNPIPIGYRNYISEIKAKEYIVRFGYKIEDWKITKPNSDRKNKVLTIGRTTDLTNYKRKGYHFIIALAKAMPDVEFTIVGLLDIALEEARKEQIPNLTVLSFVQHNEISALYNDHKVFAQISLAEGQPNTLGEAIFSGCVPVGSNVNGIPRIIQDSELIIQNQNLDEMIQKIRNGLAYSEEKLNALRTRFVHDYSIAKRESDLLNIMK